jgi:hypothetical protein
VCYEKSKMRSLARRLLLLRQDWYFRQYCRGKALYFRCSVVGRNLRYSDSIKTIGGRGYKTQFFDKIKIKASRGLAFESGENVFYSRGRYFMSGLVRFMKARRDTLSNIFVAYSGGSFVGGVMFNTLGFRNDTDLAIAGGVVSALCGIMALLVKGGK